MVTKRLATLLTGALFLSLAIVLGARTDEQENLQNRSQSRTVRVANVEMSGTTREVRFPGITQSIDRAKLAFALPARMLSRSVNVGDPVRTGQVVATLDDREFRLAESQAAAALSEIDARLEQARRDEARVRRLADVRAATREEVEQVAAGTAALEAARVAAAARHDDTRRLLKETSLHAPFDGTVTAVMLEPGEWASPGKSVLEIGGNGGIEVEIEVPETVRPGIEIGSDVRIDLSMLRRTVSGHVTSVARSTAGYGALFPVVITLDPDEEIVSGLAAEAVIQLGETPGMTVPLSAVLDSGSSRPSVFRIANDRAERVSIEPGRVVGNRLTVGTGELRQGDRVAVVGHTALVDGDQVEVR